MSLMDRQLMLQKRDTGGDSHFQCTYTNCGVSLLNVNALAAWMCKCFELRKG